jgi:hypothetical protein
MKSRWQDMINLIIGAWLFFSPWLLQYATGGTPAWDAYILGAAIVVFAAWALFAPQAWEEWTNLVLGLWLIVSPWVLGFSSQYAATWNMVIVGLVVVIFSVYALPRQSQPPTRV